jgi:hypothetical protein
VTANGDGRPKPAAKETDEAARAAARPPLGQSAGIAAWGVAFWSAAVFAGAMLDSNPTASAAVQAVIAEFGSGRVGIRWNDPEGPEQDGRAIARRAAIGAALGLAAAAIVLGAALLARLATIVASSPSFASLGIGLLVAGLFAVRDELLLHGFVLHVLRGTGVPARMLACGLASAAASLGAPGTTMPEAIAAGLAGAAAGALWIVDRGAWMAWGARTAWLLGTGTLVRGGLLDVRTGPSAWAGADAGFAGGWAAVAVLGALAAAALHATKRREGRREQMV